MENTNSGLSSDQARSILQSHGENVLPEHSSEKLFKLLLRQFKNPLILLLITAAILSGFLGDVIDSIIIITILLISNCLQFWQEYKASDAVKKLLKLVQVKSSVYRDGCLVSIPISQIVPGDVVELSAGDLVPGDATLLVGKDVFIDESSLTGETFPAEKTTGDKALFGTHVISGEAKILIHKTGKDTEFGQVARSLSDITHQSSFEKGINDFSFMLMQMTFVFLAVVFAVNIFYHKPFVDSFLFALALAIGMTPQLLPATLSTTLALGAKKLAEKKVIVKRLNAIENLGGLTVLCSDKTGTLTEGKMRLHSFVDPDGKEKRKVIEYAVLNAKFQTGFNNPVDEAILQHSYMTPEKYQKLDEIPYDFTRKRLTIALSDGTQHFVITKGAVQNILSVCTSIEHQDGSVTVINEADHSKINELFKKLSASGLRVLGIAYKNMESKKLVSKSDENGLIFLGFINFNDPLKESASRTIEELKGLGIKIKIISGDNRYTVEKVTRDIGGLGDEVMTGQEISNLPEMALSKRVQEVNAFAEVDPAQKELLIRALQRSGETVGYLGDGINDAPALYKADVGISVDDAVDIARSAASIVLLEKELEILAEGIREGRRIFANSLKYIFITTSANFGNMSSMAATSLFLPFLPLLPKQIMFNNLLTDIPALAIGTDAVDEEMIKKPRRWDMKFIKRFMFFFGLHSSFFDLLTFYFLYQVLKVTPDQFRTGWFIESSISEILVLLVIRTPRAFFKSMPSHILLGASLFVILIALILPLTVHNQLFSFVQLDMQALLMLGGILVTYILTAELVKAWFYRKFSY